MFAIYVSCLSLELVVTHIHNKNNQSLWQVEEALGGRIQL